MDAANDTSKQEFNIDKSQNYIGKLIEFLDEHLPKFPSAYKKMPSTSKDDNEDDITQDLNNYLQNLTYSHGIFMFQFQRKKRKSRRSSDIGIIARGFATFKEFFVIEAKRLPTKGKDKNGNSREKEYVEGNLGGIERYKRGHHGADLPQSAIIGYVQKENCSHWYTKINEWIKDLEPKSDSTIQWNSSDLLKETNDFGKTRKYLSKNTRIIDSKKVKPIELYHYLMELT